MANKRMFTMYIVDSDAFLDMPLSTQCLYFHLNMRADDDGFIGNPKRIQKLVGASEDDLKLLIAKRFLLVFEDGVIVIKHWKMHNTIRNDRYTPTQYQEELAMLRIKDNKSYSLTDGNQMATSGKQIASTDLGIGLDIDLDIENVADAPVPKEKKNKYGEYNHVQLKLSEFEKLEFEYGKDMAAKTIKFLDEYIEMKGYKAKNHYLAIVRWVIDAVKERESKQSSINKQPQPKKNSFNNFPQRENSQVIESIESKLLRRNNSV